MGFNAFHVKAVLAHVTHTLPLATEENLDRGKNCSGDLYSRVSLVRSAGKPAGSRNSGFFLSVVSLWVNTGTLCTGLVSVSDSLSCQSSLTAGSSPCSQVTRLGIQPPYSLHLREQPAPYNGKGAGNIFSVSFESNKFLSP